MKLNDLYTVLTGITGFSDKVAYYAFPEGEAPALPYICYVVRGSDNFAADGIVYGEFTTVDIELYSRQKDTASETLIKNALTAAGLYWEQEEEYLDDEQVFEEIFTVTI